VTESGGCNIFGDCNIQSAREVRTLDEAGLAAEEVAGKKCKLGFRGYPVGTIAFYGPDDRRASKVTAAVIVAEDTEPVELRRWFAENGDVRNDAAIFEEIAMFLRSHEVHSVLMAKEIMGCPHEEGIDYPDGEVCPQCHFWAGRERPI
jgi:hypothetical protein